MYNPADHKVQNQPFGVGAIPLNGKTLFYNTTKLVYRPFVNVVELEAYFAIQFKTPDFESIVNTGGTLNATTGKITGGTNDAYWFPNGATAVLKATNINISLYYTSAEIDDIIDDINTDIVASTLRNSLKVVPDSTNDGNGNYTNYSVIIEGAIGMFIHSIDRSGTSRWTVSDTLDVDLKYVTFDSLTGEFTFPTAFYENEFVQAEMLGTISEDMAQVVIVQNYEDIIEHSTWGGNREQTYYVLTDFENMGGDKGAYKYVPNFSTTPAQIAINF